MKVVSSIWELIRKHPFLALLAGEVFAATVSDMKDLAKYFGYPFELLGVHLVPDDARPAPFKIAYWVVCTILYFAILHSGYRFYQSVFTKKAEPPTYPNYRLYNEEIAVCMDVIEKSIDEQKVAIAVQDLLQQVGDTVLDSFRGIPYRKFRYAFILGDPTKTQGTDRISMVGLGNKQSLKHQDKEAIDWVLTNKTESHVLEPLRDFAPHHDMEAIGLVRNSGGPFRFGFVIFIPESSALTEEAVSDFYASSSSVKLIAYMDKLVDIMVKSKIT